MKAEYCRIGKKLIFKISPDKKEENLVVEREPVNHIWIYDRSGSMYSLIENLCEDMIKQINGLHEGDTITLGWFSTEGLYNWIFKGMTVNEANKKIIEAAIRKNNKTICLTCFSDILLDTERVIDDISVFPGTFNLMFMTDGYPVVSNHASELQKITYALSKINKKLSNALLIGYGDYYNKELMSKMAEVVGGALIHSSHIDEFSVSLSNFIGTEPAKRVAIPLPVYEPILACYASNDTLYSASIDNGYALVPEGVDDLYVLADESMIQSFNMYDDGKATQVNPSDMYVGLVACAYNLVSATKTDEALDLLYETGDINLIEAVNNAWTNAEYGSAQAVMLRSIFVEKSRYARGKKLNYAPDPGAFCLIDALNLLMSDDKAFFYPRHRKFNYKRIGAPTKIREGYPEFYSDSNVACSFNKLTWNKTRLNLSLLAKIDGSVDLPDGFSSVGLESPFKCHQFRNYTIVKDGILNVTSIPSSMSEVTFAVLQDNHMIDILDMWEEGEIYDVEFTAVPIVNRSMANPPTAKEYCGWINKELELEYAQKYLKYLKEKLDPTDVLTKPLSEFSPYQEQFLATVGMKPDRTYSPPVDKGETTDQYYAKEFEVKVSKFSSAPKIDDVLKDIMSSKSLTPSKKLMADIISNCELMYSDPKLDDISKAILVANDLDEVKGQLAEIRKKIQGTAFAVMLCKQWFPDLSSREGAVVNVSDREFTFTLREILVDY